MISTFTPALCVRIILNHAFPSCLPEAVGEYGTGSGYLRPLLEETIDGIIITYHSPVRHPW
jgi:hypothetical protein